MFASLWNCVLRRHRPCWETILGTRRFSAGDPLPGPRLGQGLVVLSSAFPEGVGGVGADDMLGAELALLTSGVLAARAASAAPEFPLDLIHMHINRIGLNPLEECLAAHLCAPSPTT